VRPAWTWGVASCGGVGVDEGGVDRCEAGGAGTGGLYLTWAPYKAWGCCGRLVDENEPAEADVVENVGAGETGGAI
jgi:hypothetical protein